MWFGVTVFITYGWTLCYMGFNTCMETNEYESLQLWKCGFWPLIMDTRLVPLMHLGFRGSPSLGLGTWLTWVIYFCLLNVWLWLCAANGGYDLVDRGKSALWLIYHHGIVLYLDGFHTSQQSFFGLWLQVTVRHGDVGMVRALMPVWGWNNNGAR